MQNVADWMRDALADAAESLKRAYYANRHPHHPETAELSADLRRHNSRCWPEPEGPDRYRINDSVSAAAHLSLHGRDLLLSFIPSYNDVEQTIRIIGASEAYGLRAHVERLHVSNATALPQPYRNGVGRLPRLTLMPSDLEIPFWVHRKE